MRLLLLQDNLRRSAMIIGCYDADMSKYIHTPFNLELMKIAGYYKRKREIVLLSPSIELEKASKVFYRKDYYDGDFDSKVLYNPKVTYGGRAFSIDKYIPLPEDIEKTKPDRLIYESMRKNFCTNKLNTNLFNKMQRAQHIRLTLDGNNIKTDPFEQFDKQQEGELFIFHDYNLCEVQNGYEAIQDLLKIVPNNKNKYVGSKFPLIPRNNQELIKWANVHPMNGFFNIEIHGLLKDEVLYEFIETQKNTSISQQSRYYILDNLNSDEEILKALPDIYRQIIYLRSHRIQISLIYDNTTFSNPLLKKTLDLMVHYLNQGHKMTKDRFYKTLGYDNLFSFARRLKDYYAVTSHYVTKSDNLLSRGEAREVFEYIQQNNYELFKMFYECTYVEFKGGKFQNGSKRN